MENRRRFFRSLGISADQVAGVYQVHSDKILAISKPGQYKEADALITNTPGIFLTVTTADCLPVLIHDTVTHAVAAIHAGWRGTVAHITEKTLQAMHQHYGTLPKNCEAYIGACIAEYSYEVDADVADHFEVPFKRWDDSKQKFFIDMKEANRTQLTKAGVPTSQIEVSTHCTFADNDRYFSHRKGDRGRMLSGVMV